MTKEVAKLDRMAALSTLYYSSKNLADYTRRCCPAHLTDNLAASVDNKLKDMWSHAAGLKARRSGTGIGHK